MITFQYMRYSEIEDLDSEKRIDKLLNVVKEDKIVLLEGKLSKDEETNLIRKTMSQIDDSFKGIEIATLDSRNSNISVKNMLMNLFIGNRQGVTIIGPATIVKEIKKQPDKIQLFAQPPKKKQAKRKKK